MPRWLTLTVRWLMVPITWVLIAGILILAGNLIVTWADTRCPLAEQVGGACVLGWHTTLLDWLLYGGLTLFTPLALLAGAYVAPALKRVVSLFALLMTLTAILLVWYFTRWGDIATLTVPVAITGLATLMWLQRRLRPSIR